MASNGANGADRKFKWVGTRPIRHDGVDKVTGKASFGADLSFPDMLWGKILRSPHAHARIKRIDASKALAIAGVKAVVTGADLPDVASAEAEGGEGGGNIRDLARNVMARDKALYHGHAVAAVAALTQELADQALAAIAVEYEVLKPVLSIEEALAPNAPILHDDLRTKGVKDSGPTNVAARIPFVKGDVAKGFAEAEYVVERTYRTQTVHQGYIEPHAVVARTNADGQSIVWCCTQGAFVVRAYCAAVLGLELSQLKVIPSEIGGGFGGKTTVYTEPIAVLLSRKTGRPVKMVMSREEVFRATGPAGAAKVEVKLGAKRDGTLVAAQARLWYEAGGFPGSPFGAGSMTVFAPYDVPNISIEGFDVVVNKPKTAAYRAPGAPQSAFATEQALDELARELKIDPIDLRLKNAAKEGTQAAYGAKFARIGFVETLEAAKKHPHYRAPLEPNQGRGIASGFWFNVGMQSSAEVHLAEDGTATVITGNPDIGGSRASMAICVAEELGIDVTKVRPVVGDTETAGYCDLTGGSRVTFATGLAAIEASRDIAQQLRERAAKTWGCDVAKVEFVDGRCQPAKGSGLEHAPLTVAQLAQGMAKTGGPINGRAQVNPRGAGPGFATHLCDVQVDPDTGRVDVLRYTAIQDAGKAVHPSYVEGQMQGGASQGIGWALNEEYVFDERGVLENAGFLDYRMPVASDLPMIDTVVIEVPNPGHPYGVRGVGETPIVAPLAAVANAVHAATGKRMTELPISPPRLLAALQQ
ncbi:MAG TPA: xanthine dehydrogenase family protein molybdopterin-binding subunit [Myxococcota bacterium]|nr:xanthine dehydrogenase family protein molybdopterin-binding subunit [Myxococcota bacterium]